MSTEISKVGRISLTQYWGGKDHGICIQVTESEVLDKANTLHCSSHWIQLTEREALDLSNSLISWCLDKKTVEKPGNE